MTTQSRRSAANAGPGSVGRAHTTRGRAVEGDAHPAPERRVIGSREDPGKAPRGFLLVHESGALRLV